MYKFVKFSPFLLNCLLNAKRKPFFFLKNQLKSYLRVTLWSIKKTFLFLHLNSFKSLTSHRIKSNAYDTSQLAIHQSHFNCLAWGVFWLLFCVVLLSDCDKMIVNLRVYFSKKKTIPWKKNQDVNWTKGELNLQVAFKLQHTHPIKFMVYIELRVEHFRKSNGERGRKKVLKNSFHLKEQKYA